MVEMIKTRLNGRYDLILPKHRSLRPEWTTGWEVERIDSMVDNLKEGDVVFDIGSEEGDISGLLAQKVGNGPDGGVVLFEPNPRVWPNAKAIWEANDLKKPLGCYVGFASNVVDESPGVHVIGADGWPKCAGGKVIGDHGFRHLAQETSTTPQITLDEYCFRTAVYPDLITMDVEGAEFDVLRGAEVLLRDMRPKVYVSVHPEFMKDMYGCGPEDLYRFMDGLGYEKECLAIDHEEHWKFMPSELV